MKESEWWYLAFAIFLLSGVGLAFVRFFTGVLFVCVAFVFFGLYYATIREEKLLKKKESS